MKYGRLPLKPIQFDDFEVLKGRGPVKGFLSATLFNFPIKTGKLPIRINWRYRIYDKEEHIFSYVAESRALIENDGTDTTNQDIEMMINNLLLPFGMLWEEKTKGTPLYGSTIPAWVGAPMDSFVQDIKKWARDLPLQNLEGQ